MKNKKAFVLLETIVVCGVIGILLVMMYPSFMYLDELIENTNRYNNVDYIYRTNLFKSTITSEINNDSITVICQNSNCSGEDTAFFNIKAAYVVNLSKIDTILKKSDILVTTKRFLKYLNDNELNISTDTLLVVAFESEDLTENYEYAYTEFGNNASGSVGAGGTPYSASTEINKNFITYIKGIASAGTSAKENIITYEPKNEFCTNTLAYDGTSDNNLRFVGFNPCNYVLFNNELWRIIGIMNNTYNSSGVKASRIKLIRNEAIGNYSFDSSLVSVNNGWGNKEWESSDLMQELNGDFLNYKNGTTTWYSGVQNKKDAPYDYTKGIRSDINTKYIDSVKWNLRKRSTDVESLYISESDGSPSWTGKIGLPSESDFAYAVGNGAFFYDRETCITYHNYIYLGNINCGYDNWLTNSGNFWFISGNAITNNSGNISTYTSAYLQKVFPTLYLKKDIVVKSGDGSYDSPYILS